MEPQINQEPADIQPQKSHVWVWIVIAVILTAIIVGGGVYAWQRSVTTSMQIELQKQLSTNSTVALNTPASTNPPQNETTNWKTYSNTQYGVAFKYPPTWIIEENKDSNSGTIVSFITPAHLHQLESGHGNGYDYDFQLIRCDSINTDCARGGEWLGMRDYKDIPDLLTDKSSSMQPYPELDTMIGNIKSYGVTIGGEGANYAAMLEHNKNVYILNFPSSETTGSLTIDQKQLIQTFQFLK